MSRVVLLLFALLSALGAVTDGTRIKAGDVLTVVTAGMPQYSGDFTVASDGSINIQVVGKVQVGGRELGSVQTEVSRRVAEYVKNPQVTVILKAEAPAFVYLVSENVRDGAITWVPGMDLRQLVAKHPELQPLDTYTATLYRKGKLDRQVDLVALVRRGDDRQNATLDPGDVLVLLPTADRPVWVVGAVNKPGEVRLNEGDGAAQALALAGGVSENKFSNAEITVSFRRGPDVWKETLADVLTRDQVALRAGDTISVQFPEEISVTVGGFVRLPGSIKVREGTPLTAAIASAGGVDPAGTLERTLVFRGTDVFAVDASVLSKGESDAGMRLHNGDYVYVPENRREYQVLGFVNKPGRKLLPDGHLVRLTDALAAAEGLGQKGTYRNAVLLRPGPDGRYQAARYNLDKYIKGGDATQNPQIVAGDIVFFDQTSGTTISDLLRVLPSIVLFDRLF